MKQYRLEIPNSLSKMECVLAAELVSFDGLIFSEGSLLNGSFGSKYKVPDNIPAEWIVEVKPRPMTAEEIMRDQYGRQISRQSFGIACAERGIKQGRMSRDLELRDLIESAKQLNLKMRDEKIPSREDNLYLEWSRLDDAISELKPLNSEE